MSSRRNKGILYRVKKKQNLGPTDRPFTIALIILTLFGLLMVFSASMYTSAVKSSTGSGYTQFVKQAVFVVIGLFFLYIGTFLDYRKYCNMRRAWIFYGVALLLLAAVLFVGTEVNGAKRWLPLGPLGFQPSELAKMAGIVYASTVVTEKKEVYHSFWRFTQYCILPMLVLCVLAAVEPSLSAAMAIGFGMLCVYFFAGIDFKFFLPYLAIIILGVVVSFKMQPWRIDRLMALLGKGGKDYQIKQSILAIGSGGIFGRGLGNGKQKMLFLPELQNDFIFANIGEECGLLGCVFLLLLYAYIIYRGIKIAKASHTKFGYVYGCSVMALLGFQVIVNVGVATSIFPVTGMALPFVSAGGTYILILCWMVSPIFNMSRHPIKTRKRQKRSEKEENES
ncbi:FtsW/RodA/SpoVE family cell cycle protein [Pseudoramibacter sp.]|jgi:cell division protein FtsW|uniref:FtsW/RodA/SpoVE family cell cycle protein n=1 Tax=Pseudoramibacter sp. TaxID=2034862 RepID=UPI002600AA08|nr:putative peptidoglycan glycosyltransferase FtsW [Pseudoramibacter sp.]MCH4072630.1 putative lipid II flippase FtsW [Pseudoramibacter sp.]